MSFDQIYKSISLKHKGLRTSFSMSEFGLHFLLKEIYFKRFRNIIDFGTGLSSVCIAELLKSMQYKAKIISVESDAYWLDKIKRHVMLSKLEKYIEFIYAPVFPDERMGEENKWYHESILKESIPNIPYDLVIIDGPIAYYPSIELSRYGAIPFMKERFAKNAMVVLDDCNRRGERTIMKLWQGEFGLSFKVLNERIAICIVD